MFTNTIHWIGTLLLLHCREQLDLKLSTPESGISELTGLSEYPQFICPGSLLFKL